MHPDVPAGSASARFESQVAPARGLVILARSSLQPCDEGLQHFVSGRSADARDLVADLAGAAVALGILTVFSFWPAGAIVTAITVYTLPVLARRNLMNLLPVMTTVFYVGGYATFTLLWTRCLRWPKGARRVGWAWLAASVSGPLCWRLHGSCVGSGAPFELWDMLAAAKGIIAGSWSPGLRCSPAEDTTGEW
jgi:hypothetical protein